MGVVTKHSIVIIWVMLFGLAAQGQTIKIDSPEHLMGLLVVRSNVSGASVYLDSLFLGFTPLERSDVPPGVYHLRVLHPNRRSWYRESITDTVELRPDERLEYEVAFEYVYRVHSIPYGARIFHENAFKGETPSVLRTRDLLAGNIHLTKEGYEDAMFDLSRWNGGIIKLALTPRRGVGQRVDPLDVESSEIRHKTPILISGIVGIVSGVAAVYFKQEADESFSEYQRTLDPKLLSRTDRYDTISGVSLVALEISLTSLAYLLLSQ